VGIRLGDSDGSDTESLEWDDRGQKSIFKELSFDGLHAHVQKDFRMEVVD
jgi:hypothetical protein